MIHALETGERAEADDRYIGECPEYCKYLNSTITRQEDRKILYHRKGLLLQVAMCVRERGWGGVGI